MMMSWQELIFGLVFSISTKKNGHEGHEVLTEAIEIGKTLNDVRHSQML